jgi:hypothetical protein
MTPNVVHCARITLDVNYNQNLMKGKKENPQRCLEEISFLLSLTFLLFSTELNHSDGKYTDDEYTHFSCSASLHPMG